MIIELNIRCVYAFVCTPVCVCEPACVFVCTSKYVNRYTKDKWLKQKSDKQQWFVFKVKSGVKRFETLKQKKKI